MGLVEQLSEGALDLRGALLRVDRAGRAEQVRAEAETRGERDEQRAGDEQQQSEADGNGVGQSGAVFHEGVSLISRKTQRPSSGWKASCNSTTLARPWRSVISDLPRARA